MTASGLLQHKRSEHRLGKGPLLALGTAMGWGMGFIFFAHALRLMTWQSVVLLEVVVAPLVLLVAILLARNSKEQVTLAAISKTLRSPVVWSAGITQMVGQLVINLGIANNKDSVIVIVTIASCSPALTMFLALRHMREKVPLIPLVGGIAGVIGVIILTLGSS